MQKNWFGSQMCIRDRKNVDTGTSASLNVLWAASATDVWAAGDNGTVLRWDGSKWNQQPGPSTMTVLLSLIHI